jgi:hypothetical protein
MILLKKDDTGSKSERAARTSANDQQRGIVASWGCSVPATTTGRAGLSKRKSAAGGARR